jgi:hypothetical protein
MRDRLAAAARQSVAPLARDIVYARLEEILAAAAR